MYFGMEKCGQHIKKLRKENQMTQLELATVRNITDSFLSKVERGAKSASIDLLVEIAEKFNVSLDYLILEKESKDNKLKNLTHSMISMLQAFESEL